MFCCGCVVGRAGRVAQGRVYRLVTFEFYHQHLREHLEPEMRVCYSHMTTDLPLRTVEE